MIFVKIAFRFSKKYLIKLNLHQHCKMSNLLIQTGKVKVVIQIDNVNFFDTNM